MLKIGTFSKLSRLSIRMLRRYDELGLLQPVHTDPFTGYRYYREEQLTTAGRIAALRDNDAAADLIDELTVQENIALPLLYMGVPKQERQRRVEEAMARMDIMHRSRHYPRQISGGQQQRTAIARAIVTRPKLILADEPTGNLDSKNGKEVMGLLGELHREGTTIVMVTHSQHDAGYADRIIHLFDGHVLGEEEAGLQNL